MSDGWLSERRLRWLHDEQLSSPAPTTQQRWFVRNVDIDEEKDDMQFEAVTSLQVPWNGPRKCESSPPVHVRGMLLASCSLGNVWTGQSARTARGTGLGARLRPGIRAEATVG